MRLPILPTLTVTVAVPAMIAAGLWQWGKRSDTNAIGAALARPIATTLHCAAPGSVRQVGGTDLHGSDGFIHITSCGGVTIDLGWTERPYDIAPPQSAKLSGKLYHLPRTGPWLVIDHPQPPLLPSAPPGQDAYQVNHLSYAIQWFSFAAILSVIYGRFIWQRNRERRAAEA